MGQVSPEMQNFLATKNLSLRFPPFFLSGDQVNDIPPLKPRSTTSKPKQESAPLSGESLTMANIIDYLEKRKNSEYVDVNDIVSYFCIRRKAIFDFMSIMTAIGAATRLSGTQYKWNGATVLGEAKTFMRQARQDISKPTSVFEKFACAKDASLGNITLNLLKLLAYLGRTTFALKDAATTFVQGDSRFPSMLRRLITICQSLQATNIMNYDAEHDAAELVSGELVAVVQEVGAGAPDPEKRFADFKKELVMNPQSFVYKS